MNKELFNALKIIKQYCINTSKRNECNTCDINFWCDTLESPPFSWGLKIYESIPLITKDEYNILIHMDYSVRGYYLCRNIDGTLYMFTNTPIQEGDKWILSYECTYGDVYRLYGFDDQFPSITWEDKNPKRIIDYIRAYEEKKGVIKYE